MARRLKRFFRCQRGNALIISAAVMPMLIGASAVGIDVGQWALAKRKLQRTADSAALAGAQALLWKEQAKLAAERDLQLNNQIALSSTPVIENAPRVGPYKGNLRAVRVLLTTAPKLTFASYFMGGSTEIPAEATAMITPDPKYCVVALETTTTAGVTFEGSSNVGLDCGIGANSKGNPAIAAEGASIVKATTIGGVGVVPAQSNYAAGTEILSFQPPLADPYASLPAASSYAKKCSNATALVVEPNRRVNVSPGCFAGMTLKGEVHFRPGTYVINNGSFSAESQAVLTGENVTFILTGSDPTKIGTVTITGGATLNLAPSTTDKNLKGVLFYQDSRALFGTNYITGNSTSKIHGGLYFPKQAVQFIGNSGMNTECLRMVALRVRFTGNSSVSTNCSTQQGYGLYGEKARLVG